MVRLRRWRGILFVAAVWTTGAWYMLGSPSSLLKSAHHLSSHQDSRPGANSMPPVHWKKSPERYPVTSLRTLPTGSPDAKIPKIQATAPQESDGARRIRLDRLKAVKESFEHSWTGYKKYAWLEDEVTPLTGRPKNPFGGWAATLVDALDTLWIMGMKDDFVKAVKACDAIDFSTTMAQDINVFETTIRYVGGFLGSYELSEKKYPSLLAKAVEVADLLMSAFDTPNRLPLTRWDWQEYLRERDQVAPGQMLVSEIGSLTLEFTKLSQLTGDMRYYDAVQRISDIFLESQQSSRLPGMWPIVIDAGNADFTLGNAFTLGGMSDSLYEYFPKQYLILGGLLEQPRILYEGFIEVAKQHLFWRALNPFDVPIIISGDIHVTGGEGETTISPTHQGQHLTCFAGGMVGLASRIFHRPDDLEVAIQLTDGCVWAYNSTASGIGPEIFQFAPCGHVSEDAGGESCKWSESKWRTAVQEHWWPPSSVEEAPPTPKEITDIIKDERLPPGMVNIQDRRYILRPEAIESVFMMYRITGDVQWMEKAWQMFTSINKFTRTKIAAAALEDVSQKRPAQLDSMESFWFAETLKYFYLVFSEWDVVDLDTWVLNTEAHPLMRPDA